MSKLIFFVVVLAAIGLAGWLVYAQVLQGVPVQGAEAKMGPISEFIDERAKTRLPRRHLITMPYTGRIAEITLAEGSPVKQGQQVAHLVQSDLQLAVDEATAAVERLDASIAENDDKSVELTGLDQALEFVKSMNRTVEAALERVKSGRAKKDFAEGHFQRLTRLAERNAASELEREQAEVAAIESSVDFRQDELVHSAMVAMQAATALMPTMVRQYITRKDLSRAVLIKQRQEAKARLDKVLQNQDRGVLRSPVDGVVLARPVVNERNIAAGTVLMEIGRLTDLEVETDVLSQDVVNVKPGHSATIYGPAIGEPTAAGKVTRIYPAGFTKVSSLGVEQQRVKVVIKLAEADLERLLEQRDLGVDYRVRVKIVTAEKPEALVVPRSALLRSPQGSWQVFAVRGGRAALVEVNIGLMNDQFAEIVDGISAGENVVLAPGADIEDGTRVQLENNDTHKDA